MPQHPEGPTQVAKPSPQLTDVGGFDEQPSGGLLFRDNMLILIHGRRGKGSLPQDSKIADLWTLYCNVQ